MVLPRRNAHRRCHGARSSTTPKPSIPRVRNRPRRGGRLQRVERVSDIDIDLLAIGQDDDEFSKTAGVTDQLAGVAQRGIEPRRQAGRQRRQPADAGPVSEAHRTP